MSAFAPGHCLAALGIERAEERRADAEWLRRQWNDAQVLLLNAEADALTSAGDLCPLRACDFDDDAFNRACFLGIDGSARAWFALSLASDEAHAAATQRQWAGLRHAASAWPAFSSSLFAYARALALWRERSRFCGRCGSPASAIRAGHSMLCSNPACAVEHFPRTDPAVIVLVTDGERCLLGRQAGWPPRQYSTLAGFVEPGESLEDALRREVGEEAGVSLRSCRYRSSQPWPFPSSLMLGFRAEAESAQIRLGDELEDARWFQVDALLAALAAGELRVSSPISIAFRLLHEWVAELRGEAAAATLHG